MPGDEFVFHSRRSERRKRVQLLQHLVIAAFLIYNGAQHLTGGHHLSLLPVLELFGGALMFGSVLWEKRHHAKGKHSRIGWVEIAAGIMTAIETTSHNAQGRHHTSFLIVSYLPPLLMVVLGIFDVSISRRFFRADADAFVVRRRWWVERHRWEDLEAFRLTEKRIELRKRDGKMSAVRLRDVRERSEASAWAADQFRRRGLREL